MLNQLFKYIFSLDDSYFIITLLTKPKNVLFLFSIFILKTNFLVKYFDKNQTGELVNRLSTDTTKSSSVSLLTLQME
jgi:hypothetical protein